VLGLNRFLVQEVELPLVPVLADLEETGYLINGDHFANLTSRLGKEREQLLANIRNEAGRPDFNPASSPQVRTLLFETLELPVIKKTDTGQPSTAEEALQVLRDKHPVVPLLSRYRELNKILTTYCTIPNKADPDGRLRFEFRQLGAETGRISSPSASLQVIFPVTAHKLGP
jgi:DNA polymerase-1